MCDNNNLQNFKEESGKIHPENECMLYKMPLYYDIIFERDVSKEIEFYIDCFKKYSKINVKNILEPACGTGIFLTNFPRYGYSITGYDISENMVNYSTEIIKKQGYYDKASVILGDMRVLTFDPKLDAAIISINSLGYLLTDDAIIEHFKSMSKSIGKGAIYIVEIVCAYKDIKKERKPDETWHAERNSIKIEATWSPYQYDKIKKIRHVRFKMKVEDNSQTHIFEEKHELRLWFYRDFKDLIQKGGFRIEAIFNQEFQELNPNSFIIGELGALYYVLVNT